MREELVDKLAEPKTLARLELRAKRGNGRASEIEEGELVSTETGKSYPIVGGIPRFVPREVYAETFGLQWNKYRTVQLDSEAGDTNSFDRFTDETEWTPEQIGGKWVLDAGCGAGRFAEIAASFGANLVALDMSSAIDATKATTARFKNVDFVQASLLEPPFKPGTFDYAYCIGVLQHTPDPKRGVRTVVECVRPGGGFALTIYARRPWTKLHAKYLVRPLTKRLPVNALLRGIEVTVPAVFPVVDRVFSVPVIGKIARFTMPLAVYTVSERPKWTREQRVTEAILDTFDMLSPAYDSPLTWREVTRELEAIHATDFRFKTKVPVNVIGRR